MSMLSSSTTTSSSSTSSLEPIPNGSIGGQFAWVHDDGHPYGYFQTYDSFNLDGKPRKVHVLLPRSYQTDTNRRYPVIYFNDGQTTFWKGALGKSWGVASTLSRLHSENKIRPVIAVAIHPVHRDREYSHEPWQIMRESGDLEVYSKYLSEHLKKFFDKNYRTLPDASVTAIVGSSLGGLAAFYAANLYPRSFGIIGAFSPNLWAGIDDIYNLYPIVEPLSASSLIRIASRTLKNKNLRPKIWIDWGLCREGGDHNALCEEAVTVRSKEIVELLLSSNYGYELRKDLFTFEDPLGGHDELAWGYRFGLFMETFYPLFSSEKTTNSETQEITSDREIR